MKQFIGSLWLSLSLAACAELKGPPVEEVWLERQAMVNAFAAGSLIIPMDNGYQGEGMLKAYGLVYELLRQGVPVQWAIKGGKSPQAVDFSASAEDIITLAPVTADYRGGPFIIAESDVAAAQPHVNAWLLSNPTVRVHRATAVFDADITEVLHAAPRIAVFDDGFENIAFNVLNAAGIKDEAGATWSDSSVSLLTAQQLRGASNSGPPDGALLRADGTPAYHFLISMHYDNPSAEVVREVRAWLDASALSHAYMQCSAVTAFENHVNGRYLTTSGLRQETETSCVIIIVLPVCTTSDLGPPNPVVNRDADDVFNQYDGTLTIDTGALQSLGLSSGSSFKAGVNVLLAGEASGNTRMAYVRGNLDGSPSNGIVSYLVGHDYSTQVPVGSNPLTNGARLLLNALLASSVASSSGQPNLQLTKSGPVLTKAGTVTWTISYANTGAGVAEAAVISDTLPAGATFVSASAPYQVSGTTVTWQLGTLAPGETGSVTVTASVTADGSYANQASLSYTVGLTQGAVSSNTFVTTRDATPPDTMLVPVSPAPGVERTNLTTASFTFTASEPGSTFECSLDGAAPAPCTSPFSINSLTEGTHTLAVTAIDEAGNRDPTPATHTWVVDLQAPAAPVIATPAQGDTTTGQPVISGTAEPGSTVLVQVDGVEVGTATADAVTGAWSLTPTAALVDGPHTVSATATDVAGNTSPEASHTFNVDNSVPPSPVIITPANGAFLNSADVLVTGTATPGATVHVYVDGVEVGTTTANGSGEWSFPLTGLAEGTRQVSAREQGTVLSAPAVSTVTIDLTPPGPVVIVSPADGSVVNTTSPQVAGTSEPFAEVTLVIAGVGTFVVVADAAGHWSFTLSGLSEATYTVLASVKDRAGNQGPDTGSTFTVDVTAPGVPVISQPVSGTVSNDPQPVLSGEAEPGATVQIFIDGVLVGNTTANGDGEWTWPLPSPLGEGEHQVTARAVDPAGNQSPESMPTTIIIDTTAPDAPQVTSPGDGAATAQTTPPVSGTAEPGATVTVSIDGVVIGTAVANALGTWTVTPATPLDEGPHEVTAIATDAAGNESQPSAPVSFTVDTTPPDVPVITSPVDGETTDGAPTFAGTAEPGTLVTVVIDGVPVATVQADQDGNWLYIPGAPLTDGDHVVSAYATDVAGNQSDSSDEVAFTSQGGVAPDAGVDGGADGGAEEDAGVDGGTQGHADGGTGDGGTDSADAGWSYAYAGGGMGCSGCSAGGFDVLGLLGVAVLLRRRDRGPRGL